MSETVRLGKLKSVDIRELWRHEQYDFSNWLSRAENIEYLNDVLGLSLVDVEKEVFVGAYRCDLVARDETSGIKVVIENQLEASNHEHLGKIVTYASGLDASVIVWIVKEAREEHRSAVEWLNHNTNQEISFFLIELHAYQIGDSLPAPMFEVVEQPNDFIKANRTASKDGDNARDASIYEFWSAFNEVLISRGKPFHVRKAKKDHWYDVALGTSEAHIAINLVNKANKIVLEVYITDNKDLFDRLHAHREEIESRLQMSFDWDRLDHRKASRIKHDIPGLDFEDHTNYPALMDEVIDKAVRMRDVFTQYI